MKTIFKVLLSLIFFTPLFSVGELQYRVEGSQERHEIAGGLFNYPVTKNYVPKSTSGAYLDYSFYFPEIHDLLDNQFKTYGQLGFTGKVYAFSNANGEIQDVEAEGLCVSGSDYPAVFLFGTKARISYLEYFNPSIEYGWTFIHCGSKLDVKNLKSFNLKSIDSSLNRYISIGLDVSLKLFDRASVYALDEDYGINDIGFNFKCTLLSGNVEAEEKDAKVQNKPWICQVGLSLLF